MRKIWGVAAGLNLLTGMVFGLPSVEDVSPLSGIPGDTIEISGSGLTEGNYQIRSGSASTGLDSQGENGAQFTIPAGFVTGPLVLTDGSTDTVIADQFWITREIGVDLHERMSGTNFVGSAFGDSASSSPPYTVKVGVGRTTLVSATASEEQLLGMAIVSPDVNSVEISPESTVLAMAFVHPDISDPSGDQLEMIESRLQSLPAYVSLLSMIRDSLAARQDWTAAPGFTSMLELLFDEYFRAVSLEVTASTARSNRPDSYRQLRGQIQTPLSFTLGTPRDLTKTNFAALERLVPKAGTAVSLDGKPVLTIEMDPSSIRPLEGIPFFDREFTVNPLEWTVNIYKLDPSQELLDKAEKVQNLRGSWNQVYDRLDVMPVDSYLEPATLITRFATIWGAVKSELVSFYSPGNTIATKFGYKQPKSKLEIPSNEPGLYLIRAFSGARMNLQTDLVSSLPGGENLDWAMFKWNMLVAAQDFVLTMLESHPSVASSDLLDTILKTSGSSLDAIERDYVSRGDPLDSDDILKVLKAFIDTLTDYVVDQLRKKSIFKPISSESLVGSKTNASTIALLFNIVKAGSRAAERFLAVTNGTQALGSVFENSYMAMGVEDTIVVVGDPWIPIVESFSPLEGHRGTEVRITGRNFSPTAEKNIVTFGALTTTPQNPNPDQKAEVVSATKNLLVVKVPEDSNTGPITVAREGGSTFFNTINLKEPFKEFQVTDNPVITSVFPEQPRPGSKVLIRGNHLVRDKSRIEVNFGAGQVEPVQVLGVRHNGVIVRVPELEGANNVSVTVGNRISNIFPFTIQLDPDAPGATIRVNDNTDTNVRNDTLSLREAIMLGNGELSVAELTMPPQNPPPGARYEIQQVFGGGVPGAEVADDIQVEEFEIVINSQLPSIGSHDKLTSFFETSLTGGGSANGGLLLDGTIGSTVEGFSFTSFQGPAIQLQGGAAYNNLGGLFGTLRISNGGSDGLVVLDEAWNNTMRVVASQCAGNGILLSGENVVLNELVGDSRVPSERNGGWGLKIENGANGNLVLSGAYANNDLGGILVTGDTSAANVIGPASVTDQEGGIYVLLSENLGPGIRVEAPDTVLDGLQVTQNQEHGIHIRTADAAGTKVHSVSVGYNRRRTSPNPLPNVWDGIRIEGGAQDIQIGYQNPDFLGPTFNPTLTGNLGSGLVIDGPSTHSINVYGVNIGRALKPTDNFPFSSASYYPNGLHGIHITNGASNVVIGEPGLNAVRIKRNSNGDGIRIDGDSHGNRVISGEVSRSINGIVLADQAYDNQIGLPGFDYPLEVSGNEDSGIILSSAFNPTVTIPAAGTPFVPQGRNAIQGVQILDNMVGIRLLPGAHANLIGGREPIDGNLIDGNEIAGIHIDGLVISRPEYANRIENNAFRADMLRTPIIPNDPLSANPEKVGVLITSGATGNIIGGSNPSLGNDFTKVFHGVYIDNANNNIIRNNTFISKTLTSPSGATDKWRNVISGATIRNSRDNLIGPGNVFMDCGVTGSIGQPLPPSGIWNEIGGGVVITGGNDNTVAGNLFGVNHDRSEWIGNHPDGIQVHNSANNLLGGARESESNALVQSDRYGIFITGLGSSGNRLGGNAIGLDTRPALNPKRPNGQGGIRIENEAANNWIGGKMPVVLDSGKIVEFSAPNEVLYNSGPAGIQIDGQGSIGNRILDNVISEHEDAPGIILSDGGNNMLPPPDLDYVDGKLTGTTVAPDGSRVQIFTDSKDEGAILLTEKIVQNGMFDYTPKIIIYPVLTATVTDLQNNTSPFAVAINLKPNEIEQARAVTIRRFGTIQERNVGTSGVMTTSIPIEIQGSLVPASLDTLRITESGSLNARTDIQSIMIFRDLDQNGQLSESDVPLSDAGAFDTDNGIVTFEDLGVPVDANETIVLLVVISLNESTTPGRTFALSIEDPQGAVFSSVFDSAEILEFGDYPVVGDTLTVVDDRSADSFQQWLIPQLTPEELQDPAITNPKADLDQDGIATLIEFLFGTNPLDSGDVPDIRLDPVDTNTFVVRMNHLDVPTDIVIELLASYNLSSWSDLTGIPELIDLSTTPSPVGGDNVTILLRYPAAGARVFVKLHATRQ